MSKFLEAAFVEANCSITESSETNNQLTKTYRVSGTRTDLAVTSISISPAAPAANSTVNVAVTVANQGTVSINAAGYLDVWANQSTTAVCGAEGNAWADIGSLAAGVTKTITVQVPVGAAGSKVMRVFADSWCETVEAVEINNQLTKNYAVQ